MRKDTREENVVNKITKVGNIRCREGEATRRFTWKDGHSAIEESGN